MLTISIHQEGPHVLDNMSELLSLLDDASKICFEMYIYITERRPREDILSLLNELQTKVFHIQTVFMSKIQHIPDRAPKGFDSLILEINNLLASLKEYSDFDSKQHLDSFFAIFNNFFEILKIISEDSLLYGSDVFLDSMFKRIIDYSSMILNASIIGIQLLQQQKNMIQHCTELEEKVTMLMAEKEQLKSKIEEISEKYTQFDSLQHNKTITKLEARIKFLLNIIEMKNRELAHIYTKQQRFESQPALVSKYKEYINTLRKENEELKNMLSDKAFKTVSEAIDFLKKRISSLSEENQRLRNIIQRYKELR